MNWVEHQQNVCGILNPEIDGRRKLFDIAAKSLIDFETTANTTTEELISVGRFHFYKKAFDHAQSILLQSIKQNHEWLIVDEVGKLELHQQKGLEPAITHLINHYKFKNPTGNLLLIIRDTLLNECILYYGLENATIINKDFFSAQQKKDLYGLVVCGGQSKRMGTDKSLIDYHGKPQRYFLYDLLQSCCEKVFISCNQSQLKNISVGYETIVDAPQHQNIGPMAALLSAFEKYPNKSFVLIGCDYPFVNITEIQTLINAREINTMAVCYTNRQSFLEPLLALYENSSFAQLINAFHHQNYSLRHFLEEVNAKQIIGSAELTMSVDTPEAYQIAKANIIR